MSKMVVDMNLMTAARQRWPTKEDKLPTQVRAVFDAWSMCHASELDGALAKFEGFTKPPGRVGTKQKCRDLTLLRSPLPASITTVSHLPESALVEFFGPEGTPGSPERSPDRGDKEGSDVGSFRSTPSSEERMTVMETSLSKCFETIARQHEQLATQSATLDRLFKAQADPEEIQTSTYEVADSILSKLGRTTAGKMSWLDIKPLPKSERRRILREHGGTFTTFPPDLDMLASTKALKLVQDAKVTLPNFATQEVAKFMARNTGTIKMCGTVLSRIRELKSDLTANPDHSDNEEDEGSTSPHLPTSIPIEELLDFLSVLDAATEGAMDLAIDCQTLMRLSVSRRIESALGVSHLHQDPTKRPKEDFISPKTLTLIEDAAKMREDLTWAMEARKVATGDGSSLFGGRPRKTPGGGQRYPNSGGRGQGRGTGGQHGTGKGKGKGKDKKVRWDGSKGDPAPDGEE